MADLWEVVATFTSADAAKRYLNAMSEWLCPNPDELDGCGCPIGVSIEKAR